MGIIVVGCSGVGKSYICNRIFEAYKSKDVFKTSAMSASETSRVQMGSIQLNENRNASVIDTPGFYDTDGQELDKINVCEIWKAMETCSNISAILYVFSSRFTPPTKIWYDRIVNTVPKEYHNNLVIVNNMFCGTSQAESDQDIDHIKRFTGNPDVNVCHIPRHPTEVIKGLVQQWMSLPPFTIENIAAPEICYEKDEIGPTQEKFVKHVDETKIETVTKVIDHSGYRVVGDEWDGTVGKWFGRKRDKVRWVTDIQTVNETIPVAYSREQWLKYQNVYRIRFDGTKDFINEKEIEFFLK